MKILITGVAGFLGSHLLDKLLARGHVVVGVDDLSSGSLSNIDHNLSGELFSFYRADAGNKSVMTGLARGVDCICHLAAIKKLSEANKALRKTLLLSNLSCNNCVLDIAAETGCKVVFSSTSDVYGMSPDLPFIEDGNITFGSSKIARWSYAVSKLFDEHLCFAYAEEFKIPVIIIRYFGSYGPRARYQFGEHIPLFIHKALSGEPITIHGDGLQTRSMCYVDDAIDATVSTIESDSCVGRVVNIGSDEEMSVVNQAKTICRIVAPERDPDLVFVDIAKLFGEYREIRRRVPDLTLARELLGFRPKVSFEAGIRKTLDALETFEVTEDAAS